ncbi:hypothetical protein AB205_0106530 [Aquarana catesbeiana]|uniref:Laminin G domain-containing protein n=1 Tax=Aquarana catesbeiana TaxID=8400 RepID=A0A2G9SC48_AQUCT|nr:hypothetical protein AB205_0106530 [Aquarana catesbeiana]
MKVNQYTSEKFILSSGSDFSSIHSLGLGKILAEDIDIDLETMKANANGFTGCLSAVQFNNIFPLKIAFQNNPSSQIIIKGQVSESGCGSLNGEDATSGEATHSFADHSRPMDNGEPLTNVLKSSFAVVGAIRIYLQKNTYRKNEAKESENDDNVEAAAALKAEISMQNAINESQKEYFF